MNKHDFASLCFLRRQSLTRERNYLRIGVFCIAVSLVLVWGMWGY